MTVRAARSRAIAVAVTGASGIAYALRLLECLGEAGERVSVMVSPAGQVVAGMEAGLKLSGRPAEMQRALVQRCRVPSDRLEVLGHEQWTAPLASGSGAPRALVVCPCTMGTLASIAAGASNNLIERAADVVLKEQRRLILVPRETPFSPIHLENMLKLARIGATILPANPGFYHKPAGIEALVDFVVARILDHLDVPHALVPRWGEE
jgi:flavin prenyltransferase